MENSLNDLSGKEWIYSTNSIASLSFDQQDIALYKFINDAYETRFPTKGVASYAHHIRKAHPTPKPPQLIANLINFFSKRGQNVFDPFCGVGGSLLGCSLTGRIGTGIDLNPAYKAIYEQASKYLDLPIQNYIVGDSLSVLENNIFNSATFDLIITDPPYGNMMSKIKTGESAKKKGSSDATPFTQSYLDLGNLDRESFLVNLKRIIELALMRLNNRKYVIIFIKDLQPKHDYHGMLHYDIVNTMCQIENLKYKGLKIWYDKSINLFPYGYPFAYVSNQLHQYILIFRKENKR